MSLAEGQGRNAVFLVSLGHRVLALDSSDVGLAKCKLLASQRLLPESQKRLSTLQCDLALDLPVLRESSFDLVVDIFSSLRPSVRRRAMQLASKSLKSGGCFVCECFAPRHAELRGQNAMGPTAECLVDADTLMAELGDDFAVLFKEEVEIVLKEGPFHNGRFVPLLCVCMCSLR